MRSALALTLLAALHCNASDAETDGHGGDATSTKATTTSGATTGAGGTGGGDPGCPAGSHEGANGCEATFLGYTEGPPLLEARDHHVSFVYETPSKQAFLYVLGGMVDQSSAVKSIERATIAADGTLGAWEPFGNLPRTMVGHGFTRVGDAFVMSGGFYGPSKTDILRLGPDGTITSWENGPALAVGRAHHMMVTHGDRIYAVGGLLPSADNTPSVETTTYDGATLAPWTETTPLPAKRSHHAVVATDDGIFVLGGISGDPAGVYESYKDVLFAAYQPDGSLAPWSAAGELPAELSVFSGFAHAGYIYIAGGLTGSAFKAETRRAPILAGGRLGAWEELAPLPIKRGHVHQIPRHGDVFYHAGGYDGSSQDRVFIGRLE